MRRSFTRLVRPSRRRAPAEARSLTLAERVAVNAAAQLASQFALALGGLLAVAVTTRYLDIRQYGALVTALIFVGLFALGAAIAVSQIAYAGPGGAEVRKAILILLPQLLVVGPRSLALAYLVARQKIYLSSFAGVTTRVVTLGLVVAVAKADLGFVAMVAAYAAFPILGAVLIVALARTGLPRLRSWNRSLAMKLLKLSLPLGGVVIANYLYFRLGLFLLSIRATQTDVALYGIA